MDQNLIRSARLPSWHTVRVDGSLEVIGARNLDTLRQRLAPHMLRRVRGDVLAQLPPRRDLRISVALTEAFCVHWRPPSRAHRWRRCDPLGIDSAPPYLDGNAASDS